MEPSTLESAQRSVLLRRFRAFGSDAPLPPGGLAMLLARSVAIAGRAGQGAALEPWEHAAAQVVVLNAQISVMTAFARSIGGAATDPVLPEPLSLDGLRLEAIDVWCRCADRALALAQRALRERSAAVALRRLEARRPALPGRILAAAGALTGRRLVRPALLDEQVLRRLDTLDPQTPAHQVERALETAARAVASSSSVPSRSYADQLISLVRVINTETAQLRREMLIAACYLQALSATLPHPHVRGEQIMARLDEVVAGQSRLSGDLQDAAERLRGQLEETFERSSLAEVTHRFLADRGFTVLIDNDGAVPAIVVTAFSDDNGSCCGTLTVTDGIVAGAPPGRAPSAEFTRAVEQLRSRLGPAITWDLEPPAAGSPRR